MFVSRHKGCGALFLAERRTLIGDKYVNTYIDEISALFADSLIIEQTNRLYDRGKIAVEGVVFSNAIDFICYIERFLFKILFPGKVKKIRKDVSGQISKPLEKILEVYNSEDCFESSLSFMVNAIILFTVARRLYRRYIYKLHPRIIVEECHYNLFHMISSDIAHELDIPVVELQHGTMHEDHIAYQYGYDVHIPLLPDYIFTFSDYWNHIANLPKSSTQLISTGFPYFEEQVAKTKENTRSKDSRTTIIFLSSGLETKLDVVACQLTDMLDHDKYRVIYKLHPFEYNNAESEYSDLLSRGIELKREKPGLYELFAVSDIQVGTFTTAIYEGLGFGLRTYILNEGFSDTMRHLEEGQYATFFNNPEELHKLVLYGRSGNAEELTEFWAPNALENIKMELNIIAFPRAVE